MSIVRQDVSEYDLRKPTQEQIIQNTYKTKSALEQAVEGKIAVAKVGSDALKGANKPYCIQYKGPTGQEKLVMMYEQQTDPMDPIRFLHRRVPRGPSDAPVPIERSPPRKLTINDQKDWKIPPCISNWKNSKSYTIPLEMRLSADGRHLQDTTVSSKFPKLAEALYQTERNAREEVENRAAIQKKLAVKEAMKKGQQMRDLATQALAERAKLFKDEVTADYETSPGHLQRDELRYARSKEIERDRRMEVSGRKKIKLERDDERDISEKIALGQAKPTKTGGFDERLYNQDTGKKDVYDSSSEDEKIYDKPLFSERASTIYRPKKDTDDSAVVGRSKPVEFERGDEFGLGELAAKARARKN